MGAGAGVGAGVGAGAERWRNRKQSLTSGLYYKRFTIVIYDRNDIGLYYKTRDERNWRS